MRFLSRPPAALLLRPLAVFGLVACSAGPRPTDGTPGPPAEGPGAPSSTPLVVGEVARFGTASVIAAAAFVAEPGLQPHPGAPAGLLSIQHGARRLAVGFSSLDPAATVSADLDGDGKIGAGEAAAAAQPGGLVELRGPPPPGPDGQPGGPPFVLQVSLEPVAGGVAVRFGFERTARGWLPDGTAVHAYSHGGRFDLPGARLALDRDGDGTPDGDDLLSTFPAGDPCFLFGGAWVAFSLSADGSTLRLSPTTDRPVGPRAGAPAPDFALQASDGRVHRLADYRGAPLLLDFWATWCAPCIALHPEIEAWAAETGVAVLGVAADDSQVGLEAWLRRHPPSWPSAAVGPAGAVNLAYGVSQWPQHALIDAEGRLLALGSFAALQKAALREGVGRRGAAAPDPAAPTTAR